MKIFVVAGKAGSGKSLVAKYINEYYIYKLENRVVTNYSKYLKTSKIIGQVQVDSSKLQ